MGERKLFRLHLVGGKNPKKGTELAIGVFGGLSMLGSNFSRLVVTVALGLLVLESAHAATPSVREVQLKTLGEQRCILGFEVSAPLQRQVTLKRYRVEVLDKQSRKWRLRRQQAFIRARTVSGKSIILDRLYRKTLYRYTLVDKRGNKLSRSKVGKLSNLPLCARSADGVIVTGGDVTIGGGSSPTPTPTPSPTPTPPALKCVFLDELLQNWGGTGDCDLDNSGIIDSADLGYFLSRS